MKLLTLSLILALQLGLGSIALAKPKDLGSFRLRDLGLQTLQYVLDNQVQTEDDKNYVKGEWPTQIETTLVPALVGVGNLFSANQEASAFSTASVINVIGKLYLAHPELQDSIQFRRIPQALMDGVASFDRYASQGTYNFYPPLFENGIWVRRPIDMSLAPLWFGFTNIPNDADTTSAVLAAKIFNARVNQLPYSVPNQALETISEFRDLDREPMFYNRREGRRNTGGFLTWLIDESSEQLPRGYFASPDKGPRIPFRKNDVDCVVNASVLRLLALAKRSDLEGHDQACLMLNDMIEQNEHASCGIYYPNTLNLSYMLAAATEAGETCIKPESQKEILKMIINKQAPDGSWVNDENIWHDPTITTAYAMAALLQFADAEDESSLQALRSGVYYLLHSAKFFQGQIYWAADHFFTATAIARSLVMWRSPAYTNAIISSVLLKIDQRFPNYLAQNYLLLRFE